MLGMSEKAAAYNCIGMRPLLSNLIEAAAAATPPTVIGDTAATGRLKCQ